MPSSQKNSKKPKISKLNFIKQKTLIKEFAMDAAECFAHVCKVADRYGCDREDAMDLFLLMLSNVSETIDIETFDLEDKSYLSQQ